MLKYVRHSAPIDLTSLDSDAEDELLFVTLLRHGIWSLATKRLRDIFEEFEDKETDAGISNSPSFPWTWISEDRDNEDGIGGKPPDDPLTIHIDLPLGYHCDSNPVWALTVTECVDDLIDGNVGGESGKIDPGHKGAIAIRDALRAQAQRIDDMLDKERAE